MHRVKLNKTEQLMVLSMCIDKTSACDNRNIQSSVRGPQSSIQTDITGLGGEVACAKYLGIYPNLEFDTIEIPKHDLILPNGLRVDVKTTEVMTNQLLVPYHKKDKGGVEIYILVVGTFPEFYIIGWLTAEEVFDEKYKSNPGHRGECYMINQVFLHPMEELPDGRVNNKT